MPFLTIADIERIISDEIKLQQPHLKSRLSEELQLSGSDEMVLASSLSKLFQERRKSISAEVFMIPMDSLTVCSKQFFSIVNFRVAQQWVAQNGDITETTNITNIMVDDEAWKEFQRTYEKNDCKLAPSISGLEVQQYRNAISKEYRFDMRHCRLLNKHFQMTTFAKMVEAQGLQGFDSKMFQELTNVSKVGESDKAELELQREAVVSNEKVGRYHQKTSIREMTLRAIYDLHRFEFRADQKTWLNKFRFGRMLHTHSSIDRLRWSLGMLLCVLKRETFVRKNLIAKEQAFRQFQTILVLLNAMESGEVIAEMEVARRILK